MAIFNPYRKSTTSIDYYDDISSNTEPNIRQELIDMFDGKYPQIAKAQTGLLRKMRRDSNDQLISCGCIDPITRESDKDRFCPICFGSSYLWDEEEIQFYKILTDSDVNNILKDKIYPMGLINISYIVFYIRYSCDITTDDRIVELELDISGNVVVPTRRRNIYKLVSLWDYRADNAKLEYWKAFTHKEDVKYLNTPVYGDI